MPVLRTPRRRRSSCRAGRTGARAPGGSAPTRRRTGQRGVAVSLAEVAEHLVVRAVLLDHVDDVPDRIELRRLGAARSSTWLLLRTWAVQAARRTAVVVDARRSITCTEPRIMCRSTGFEYPAGTPPGPQPGRGAARTAAPVRSGAEPFVLTMTSARPSGVTFDIGGIPRGRDEAEHRRVARSTTATAFSPASAT